MQISTTLALFLQKKRLVFDSAGLRPYSCFKSASLTHQKKNKKVELKHSLLPVFTKFFSLAL